MKRFGLLALAVVLVFVSAQPARTVSASGPNRATLTCVFWQQYQRYQVDSIVSPGVQVSAHSHDFYGRQDISDNMFAKAWWPPKTTVGVSPTYDPGYGPIASSCNTYGDWAGYWFPTPLWNGSAIQDPAYNIPGGSLTEVWQSPSGVTVATPPWGFLSVVGNAHATGESNEGPHVSFNCGTIDGTQYLKPQDCTGVSGIVTGMLIYPDCFDGQNQLYQSYAYPAGIDPAHFAYDVNGTCPSGFTTQIAQLITLQHFLDPRTNLTMVNPNNTDGTLGLSFSSGAYYTYHGDYLDSWNITLDSIVQGCLNQLSGYTCPTLH
jgi:hypothetical protein